MQKVDPMVKQISQLINARFDSFEVRMKAEIKSSVKSSEERLTEGINGVKRRVGSVERRAGSVENRLARIEKKVDNIESKLEEVAKDHGKRIRRLEVHTGLTTP